MLNVQHLCFKEWLSKTELILLDAAIQDKQEENCMLLLADYLKMCSDSKCSEFSPRVNRANREYWTVCVYSALAANDQMYVLAMHVQTMSGIVFVFSSAAKLITHQRLHFSPLFSSSLSPPPLSVFMSTFIKTQVGTNLTPEEKHLKTS